MSDVNTILLSRSAAEVYETYFVPALFAGWVDPVLGAARPAEGEHLLDVATGTGIVARGAVHRVGAAGRVVGIDANEGMLAVARDREPRVEWKVAFADSLPFDDRSFDAVVCQFALMFFANPITALTEMVRVLRPGGRLVVAVWAPIATSPGYATMASILDDLFGPEIAGALHAPFALGEPEALGALFDTAGLEPIRIVTREGRARFPSIDSWVYTDIRGWTLADQIDDEQYALILETATERLRAYAADDGTVDFAAPGHIVTYTRPV